MVSIGPSSQGTNFTHMFDFVDLRGKKNIQKVESKSLMGVINTNPNFSKFKILVKLAMMESVLESPQSDFTLFIPSDEEIKKLSNDFFEEMDIGLARHIVKTAMINRKIPSELLEDSAASYFITNDPPNKLFVWNEECNTFINKDVKIIQKDIITSNGIIHVIDKLIWPYLPF
jgi:uncharacterized surface protein with fasciclin (FAS1) repeats